MIPPLPRSRGSHMIGVARKAMRMMAVITSVRSLYRAPTIPKNTVSQNPLIMRIPSPNTEIKENWENGRSKIMNTQSMIRT